jgi:uncharacterized protein YjbI with pentapeptide repeats
MAYFYKGFTYEFGIHESTPLVIEGRRIENAEPKHEVAIEYIKSRLLNRRDSVKALHMDELRRCKNDRNEWNAWRAERPEVRPILADADLKPFRNLDGFDFSYTNFGESDLSDMSLKGANFHQAILAAANFTKADLEGANFCRADLYETNFSGAILRNANLQGTQLVRTMMDGAELEGCLIYGLSAWDLKGQAKETGLRVRYRAGTNDHEVEAYADSLALATFMHLTSDRVNIGRVIEATSQKWVLLLGRFTDESKEVLKALDEGLRNNRLMPIIFDFPPAGRRDLIETLILLAGLSAFVVVDITEPRSTPLELMAIAPTYAVPILPIQRKESEPFAMFSGLARYPWVRKVLTYEFDNLGCLQKQVLDQVMDHLGDQEKRRAAASQDR